MLLAVDTQRPKQIGPCRLQILGFITIITIIIENDVAEEKKEEEFVP